MDAKKILMNSMTSLEKEDIVARFTAVGASTVYLVYDI